MQPGSRCNEDQNATRIKMQWGSRCNEDQDATRIKMQWGSRCDEDKDATRINKIVKKWSVLGLVHILIPYTLKSEFRTVVHHPVDIGDDQVGCSSGLDAKWCCLSQKVGWRLPIWPQLRPWAEGCQALTTHFCWFAKKTFSLLIVTVPFLIWENPANVYF